MSAAGSPEASWTDSMAFLKRLVKKSRVFSTGVQKSAKCPQPRAKPGTEILKRYSILAGYLSLYSDRLKWTCVRGGLSFRVLASWIHPAK